jgi:hypothetical protein
MPSAGTFGDRRLKQFVTFLTPKRHARVWIAVDCCCAKKSIAVFRRWQFPDLIDKIANQN